jgi:hypothetical protein
MPTPFFYPNQLHAPRTLTLASSDVPLPKASKAFPTISGDLYHPFDSWAVHSSAITLIGFNDQHCPRTQWMNQELRRRRLQLVSSALHESQRANE